MSDSLKKHGVENIFKSHRRHSSLTYIEYKASLEGIEVRYLYKKETRNTSKIYHRCGYITQVKGGIFRCPNCGMEYEKDLNACMNIAHRVMSYMGWGSREPPKPADVTGGVKPQLNAGSPRLQWERLTSRLRGVLSIVDL